MKSKSSTSVSSCISTLSTSAKESTREIYLPVKVNGRHEITALVDSGATHTFMTRDIVNHLDLDMVKENSSTRMANRSTTRTDGYVKVNLLIKGISYEMKVTVVDSLVADMILGMDLLGQHSSVELKTGGTLPKFTCSLFPAMNIDPPNIFSSGLPQNMKPIVTKTRYVRPNDREFMQQEIKRLLELGIIEKSSSPWRAQAFVVRGRKPRMVVDYSETINLFTNLDAYPFTNMESLLNSVAENEYFTQLDLKSAYHQVPIQEKDRIFTAFEANGNLFQFSRLPFGITNAVPVFQRLMDDMVRNYDLQRTYPYLDDITICGRTLEEHDENL